MARLVNDFHIARRGFPRLAGLAPQGGTTGRRTSFFLLLLLCAAAVAPASAAASSPGGLLWSGLVHADTGKTIAPNWQEAVAVAPTGDVYVTGTQALPSADLDFQEDIVVARYSTSGGFKWRRAFDGGAAEIVTDAAADHLGNVVLCGRVGAYDGFLVVKYSRKGSLLWTRRLKEGPGLESAEQLAIDGRGNIYVAGTHATSTATGSDLCLVKYSPAGRRLWLRTYAKADISAELARGPDGKLYVAGTQATVTSGDQVCILRYSTSGRREWVKVIGTSRGVDDWVWDLDVRGSGICVSGQTARGGDLYGFAARLDLDGTRRYWRTFPGGSFTGCGIDAAGRVSVTGWNDRSFCLRRLSPSGAADSYSSWNASGNWAVGEAIAVTASGYVYATGFAKYAETDKDIWTVGFTPTWQQAFVVSRGSPTLGEDAASDICLAAGSLYVAGHSDGDLVLLKYAR